MKGKVFHIVLLVFVLTSITYYPAMVLSRYLHRQEMKAKVMEHIDERHLSSFTFAAEEYKNLEWEDGDREFRMGKNMYDIVKRTLNLDGTVTLVCINDDVEEALIERADRAANDHAQSNGPVKKVKKFLDLKFDPITTFSSVQGVSLVCNTTAKPYTRIYKSFSFTNLTPPPEAL